MRCLLFVYLFIEPTRNEEIRAEWLTNIHRERERERIVSCEDMQDTRVSRSLRWSPGLGPLPCSPFLAFEPESFSHCRCCLKYSQRIKHNSTCPAIRSINRLLHALLYHSVKNNNNYSTYESFRDHAHLMSQEKQSILLGVFAVARVARQVPCDVPYVYTFRILNFCIIRNNIWTSNILFSLQYIYWLYHNIVYQMNE